MTAALDEKMLERWRVECDEWQRIAGEMIAEGKTPSAFDVSQEQSRRMIERGEVSITDTLEFRRMTAPTKAAYEGRDVDFDTATALAIAKRLEGE